MDGGIRAVWPGARLAGTAVTVAVPPGELGGVRDALELIGPGDILVVDAAGDVAHAVLGDTMAQRILEKGGAGVVVDGAVRDTAALGTLALPVFARGVTPRRATGSAGGSVCGSVTVGGIAVRAGDLVVGDADGVVCIPEGVVARLLAAPT